MTSVIHEAHGHLFVNSLSSGDVPFQLLLDRNPYVRFGVLMKGIIWYGAPCSHVQVNQ
jgi:hypothetical protein